MRRHLLLPLLGLALAIAGCSATTAAAPPPVPPKVPGEVTTGPDLTGVKLPNFVMPIISGPVSRPNSRLTPGAVVTTDTNVVCAISSKANSLTMSLPVQTAVYDSYGYFLPAQQHKYILDYLVPITLGGSTRISNVWPAATKGTGFYQKTQLDHVLRSMVCQRSITLATAQQALEQDWYAAWLRYVVATGHY